jgi:hypothetical protein
VNARRARLERLRAAYPTAIDRNGCVVRNVLRLERHDLQALARKGAAKPGNKGRLADMRARALNHQGAHQNSIPSWAFTPAEKWCFTSVISVTRSAASISSGLALRPVTTT